MMIIIIIVISIIIPVPPSSAGRESGEGWRGAEAGLLASASVVLRSLLYTGSIEHVAINTDCCYVMLVLN